MLKRFLRWPFFFLFAALVLVALIPIVHAEHYGIAFAVGNGPQITATTSVTKGQPFQLHVQGFAASEPVQLSWNGNGGQFLGVLNTDATGAATNCANRANCVVSPPVPAGTYTLTAIGSTSRLQASTTIHALVNVVVTPQNVALGSTIQVIGNGFPAREKLIIYLQTPTNGTASTTTNGTGSFTQALLLPKTYNLQTSYSIYVDNLKNIVQARVPFSFATPSITVSTGRVAHRTSVTINGKGFLAHEAISLYASIQRFGWIHIGAVSADASGNFTQTMTVSPVFSTITVTLNAIGSSSNLRATTSVTLAGTFEHGWSGDRSRGSWSVLKGH